MNRIACLAVALFAALLLGGCEDKSAERKISERPADAKVAQAAKPEVEPAPDRPGAQMSKRVMPKAKPEAEPAPERPEKKDWKKSARKAEKKDEEPAPAAEAPRTLGGIAPPFGPGSSGGGSGRAVRRTPVSPELSSDQELVRRRDKYIAGLKKGAYTFDPPPKIEVEQRVTVALWVDPHEEAAQLAEEMKRAMPASAPRIEAGATTWSPRMRATLTGPYFEITSVEGKDFNGEKELSMTARTEWSWTLVPTFPGTKQLHLLLSVVLPPNLGEPRELPQIDRDVEVKVTVWWLIDHYWEKYWKWMIGGLAAAIASAIGWWWRKRYGGGNSG